MRILTWNVNGIKTLPQFHPWNSFSAHPHPFESILNALNADIICFQETKITREKIDRGLACLPSWDAFFSSYRRTPPKGYSGTAIYTKRSACVPFRAEEGLTGIIQSENNEAIRIGSYPSFDDLEYSPVELRDIDQEGRATVLDLGLFVLFNLYCPNQTNDARLEFKNAFDAVLEARIAALVKAGREVMVVGDINICARAIDHCEPYKRAKDHGLAEFEDHSSRQWFNSLLTPKGILIDLCRHFYPNRKGMFTCWETKISARETNFGTRIDYILVTPGLMRWVKHSDIQADVKGSDHCPVFVDLHDEIEVAGETLSLWDAINPPERVKLAGDARAAYPPPPFAARNYKEFAAKSIKSFFVAKPPSTPAALVDPTPSPPEVNLQGAFAALRQVEPTPTPPSLHAPPVASTSRSPSVAPASKPALNFSQSSKKPTTNGKGSTSKPIESQASISSFFAKPKPKTPAPTPKPSTSKVKGKGKTKAEPEPPVDLDLEEDVEEEDVEAMIEASQASAEAWSSLFKPPPVPKCEGHGEPCKQWTVNKPGPNKGRVFWLCARPVGEGYDRGQSKAQVNTQYRCNHFQWAASIKRTAVTGATSESGRVRKRPKRAED